MGPLLILSIVLLVCLTGVLGLWYWASSTLPPVQKGVVAFFHPFADGGGGGERVLWCAVKAVQDTAPSSQVVIYVHQGVTAEELVQDAANRFNIHVAKPIQVVPLAKTDYIKPEKYPRFTLLGQAVGAVMLGQEALSKLVPEVYIDTTGWAFTFPLAWQAGAKVACYVHYPTISTNMLNRVWSGATTYNNDQDIAESPIKTVAKLAYYYCVAFIYGISGAFAQVTMVNSSWTKEHIQQLWWTSSEPILVYPPCDTTELQKLPLDRKLKHLFLISVNQFRPEKNHRLQLEAYALARRQAGDDAAGHAVRVSTLKIVGGCRNAADESRLADLQQYAAELGLADCVEWIVNAPFSDLKSLLGDAVGGLHTMIDEHFGISVVEYMASGVIPIANNSGGPKADIVQPILDGEGEHITGFLASTVEEYAEAITKVLAMDQRDRLKIAAAAQQQAAQFSEERFYETFKEVILPMLPSGLSH